MPRLGEGDGERQADVSEADDPDLHRPQCRGIDRGRPDMAQAGRAGDCTAQRDMPTLIARLFSAQRPAARRRRIDHFERIAEATVASIFESKDGVVRPFPAQVDGDYIGEKTEMTLRDEPGPLTVVA
jgi:hypothetical protein